MLTARRQSLKTPGLALAAAGARGIALSFVNYTEELPYFGDEILPRLRRLGLRD